MDQPDDFTPAARRDGWSPARKAAFLDRLAQHGDVRAACGQVRISPQAAYVERRRDPLFARGWMAALVLAQDHSQQVLGCRALDGVEEPVFYRGEIVGTRRRYDSRLLLAHLAHLSGLAHDHVARDDAGRFDELLALVAGAEAPDHFACDLHGLPLHREEHAQKAVEEAESAAAEAMPPAHSEEQCEEQEALLVELGNAAHAAASAEWDAWRAAAFTRVDDLGASTEGEAESEAAPPEYKSLGSASNCAPEPRQPCQLRGLEQRAGNPGHNPKPLTLSLSKGAGATVVPGASTSSARAAFESGFSHVALGGDHRSQAVDDVLRRQRPQQHAEQACHHGFGLGPDEPHDRPRGEQRQEA